jgi:predicted methyltransferase
MKKQLISAITLVFTLATGNSLALEGDEAMAARINQQLEEDRGNQYDAVKDSGRKPVETAQFFGIKAGMTVLDSHAGQGITPKFYPQPSVLKALSMLRTIITSWN